MNEEEHDSFQKLAREEREEEEIDSVRHSREALRMRQPLNHTSGLEHAQLIRDPAYRSGFTLAERSRNWLKNCFHCSSNESSFVSSLDDIETKSPASLSDEDRKQLDGCILKLKIIETSRLELNPNVMHPFVKVHIVDKNTGCYLKVVQDEPVVYHHEQITLYDKIEKRYDTSENDILLPFATACCNFRQHGNSRGNWDQKFFINCPATSVMNPRTVFLFQILDFNHEALLYRDTDIYDKDNFYRVAWGFLRPVGIGHTHFGKLKIELYRYKFNSRDQAEQLSKSYIPSVYYDFIWSSHEKYDAFLTVQLISTKKPRYKIIEDEQPYATHLFEEQQIDKKYLQRFGNLEKIQEEQDGQKKLRQELLKFYRNREICEVPKQLIYKLQSNRLGCYRVLFIGNYVFAACSNKKSTSIKIYSLENGKKRMTLKGHRDIIHHLCYTPNERYLVSSGSDHLVRIWEIPQDTGDYIDEDQSESYLRGECVHSAAIYSTSMLHYPSQDSLYLLTCCFDGYIRLWENDLKEGRCEALDKILLNDYERTSQKVYPTASTAAESYFIVGDSLGLIRIYDFNKERLLTQRCVIENEELLNDAIFCLNVLNKNHLIVQVSDNVIRHYELLGSKLRLNNEYTGAVFENDNTIINCAVSPDNKYLLAPSANGRPYLWDVFTGAQIDISHLNLSIKGKLTSCDWHNKYNLVAFSGFVPNCPIFVFGNVLGEAEIKMVATQII